jgi:hypothetical protein
MQAGDFLSIYIVSTDSPVALSEDPNIVFGDVNIHNVGTYNVYYGDAVTVNLAAQAAAPTGCSYIPPLSVASFRHLRASTCFLKSGGNLQSSIIVASGVLE